MIIISIANLSFGIHINYSWQQILLISIAMLGVGFSEEILFRSFLIRAVQNKNTKIAILLPSIIFGLIHIANKEHCGQSFIFDCFVFGKQFFI